MSDVGVPKLVSAFRIIKGPHLDLRGVFPIRGTDSGPHDQVSGRLNKGSASQGVRI